MTSGAHVVRDPRGPWIQEVRGPFMMSVPLFRGSAPETLVMHEVRGIHEVRGLLMLSVPHFRGSAPEMLVMHVLRGMQVLLGSRIYEKRKRF